MRLTPILLLAACTGGADDSGTTVEIADYELTLEILTPGNQEPFASLDELFLVVEPAAGEPVSYPLSSTESGTTPKIEDLPELEGATLAIEGYRGGQLVSFGRSEEVDALHGESTVQILVGNVDEFAALNSLSDGLMSAAAASDGLGGFYVFGGSSAGFYSSGDTNAILKFQTAPPSANLTFEQIGTMPALSNGEEGRMGHTATLLTGASDRQGLILVAGGTTRGPGSGDGSEDAFLWDPASGEVASSYELREAIYHHMAIESSSGLVVLASGFAQQAGNGLVWGPSVQIYDPVADEVRKASGTISGPLAWAAGASAGTDGVLICGGIDLVIEGSEVVGVTTSTVCDRVTTSGAIGEAEELEEGVGYAAMASIEGGVLLSGGVVSETDSWTEDDTVNATRRAWVNDGSSWREVGSMNHPRAQHRMVSLPDGRVLVLGGVTEVLGSYPSGLNSMACAEIYDPATETFTELDACDPDDEAASLPAQVSMPAVASDPQYGVIVVGGLDASDRSSDDAALLLPCPDDDKC